MNNNKTEPALLNLALIQMQCLEDPKANLNAALKKIEEAAKMGATLVCLPELFLNRYFPIEPKDSESFKCAEQIPGPTSEALSSAARKHNVYLVGGSIFEKEVINGTSIYYNTALVFSPTGEIVSKYRKCHIPQDPGFFEKDYFSAGDKIKVIDTPIGKICVMICFDQWFPEAARQAALQGAQLIIYPTAIRMPDNVENITGDWREMWQVAQRGHAAVNNVYVAAINRVGIEPSKDGSATTFFGGSFISDFAGHKIVEAKDKEEIIMAGCDLDLQLKVQEAWCFFPNRLPALY